ncbi:hypothetical protein BGW36DRAFT_378949 [Talaromyces proteolyticus]|uniref:Enoyl reductase (ER) domain-containing protein n=1 Tax=Talaromyces proteolyticus TaxID=1131652 RepID=A0AAD4KRC2_9EURO|nr:uncharacterized protein BGW36DRAFT_378949 [Talaromyces proteolyticus]KAH8697580.1 hypothetical protein BGW36DRAFT_378949 [Talaromyces proteolyticus]
MAMRQTKMRAVRIQRASDAVESMPYSADNPAPPSALHLENEVPIPQLEQPGEILIRVHAATVTRDELTWPETYQSDRLSLGHDFAGEVVSVFDNNILDNGQMLRIGDYVYGMTAATGKGSTWAEFAVVSANEVARKPANLDWASSATVPMSALTAWQALYVHAGVTEPDPTFRPITNHEANSSISKKISPLVKLLVTGASGAVGSYLVQLGALSRLHVTTASSSKARNAGFLRSLGGDQVVEYEDLLDKRNEYDIIIDTVGGQYLESCWRLVKDEGCLITVDSSSLGFVEKHTTLLLAGGKEKVKALDFIVEPSNVQLKKIATLAELGLLKGFVAQAFPFNKACEAYEMASKRQTREGKIVLLMQVS